MKLTIIYLVLYYLAIIFMALLSTRTFCYKCFKSTGRICIDDFCKADKMDGYIKTQFFLNV